MITKNWSNRIFSAVFKTPEMAKLSTEIMSYQIGTSTLSTSRWVKFNSVIKYPEFGKNKNQAIKPITSTAKEILVTRLLWRTAPSQEINSWVRIVPTKMTTGISESLKLWTIGLNSFVWNKRGRITIVPIANKLNKMVTISITDKISLHIFLFTSIATKTKTFAY